MYEWIKALHVIAVIAWMAGMLYLPRLFVYHCEAEAGSKQSETFKLMERRLLKAIINPAMIVTWLAGLYLAWAGHWFSAPWLHGKLLLVVVLSGAHGFFSPQCISCRHRAGCCCNGNAVAHPRLGAGGRRPSSRRRAYKRRWLLSLQDRGLPSDRDLGWLWADTDPADPRYERL